MQEQQIQQLNVCKLNSQTFSGYTVQNIIGKNLSSQGFSLKYDPQNQYIGIACSNGTKILYSIIQSNSRYYQLDKVIAKIEDINQIPATCLKWRPKINTVSKVIGVTNADGHFQYWHVPTMKKLFTIQQKQNSIHCCDFSKTGQHFATAGKDCNIRIYDQNTKSISTTLGCAEWNYRGHSNRIFAIKFIDDNTMISGGWDSVIHLWDIRQAKSVNAFYGPHVAGDSIDVKDNSILIGCYAAKDQLQFWDLKKFQQVQAITWTSQNKQKLAYVYTACFNPKNKETVLAGACGVNEVKLFTQQNGVYGTAIRLSQLKHGCFSVDMSSKKKQFAFTTAHHGLYVYKYDK